jgi:hypothetical protein
MGIRGALRWTAGLQMLGRFDRGSYPECQAYVTDGQALGARPPRPCFVTRRGLPVSPYSPCKLFRLCINGLLGKQAEKPGDSPVKGGVQTGS